MNDYYDIRLKEANLQYLVDKHGLEKIKIYYGDICHIDFMSNIFEKERPTHICHLAARAGVRPSIVDPYIYVHSNIEGTTRLLDLARQYACKNFVYASSSSVYGCSTNEVLSESDLVEKPVSPYAATKKACELLAYTFHHLYGLNCTGLRFFTVYGPRGRPDMAPFKFIERIFNGVPIQQYGDGSTSRDYTYIDDIVDGVVRSIDRPLGYEVINLGNGRPFRLSDFISLVESCVGRRAVIEVLPEQPGDVERTCADISKARRLLGYNPQVSFETGIARTADWYKRAHAQGLFRPVTGEPEVMSQQLQFNFVPAPLSPPLSPSNTGSGHTDSENDSDHSTVILKSVAAITKAGSRNSLAALTPPAPPSVETPKPSVVAGAAGGMGGDEDLDNYQHYYVEHSDSSDDHDNSDEGSVDSDSESEEECNDSSTDQDQQDPVETRVHYHYHGDGSQQLKASASGEMVQSLVESVSDLELSSFVEKTPIQITFRSNRFVTRNVNIYINK